MIQPAADAATAANDDDDGMHGRWPPTAIPVCPVRATDNVHGCNIVRFTMSFRSKFLESSEPIHFWNP